MGINTPKKISTSDLLQLDLSSITNKYQWGMKSNLSTTRKRNKNTLTNHNRLKEQCNCNACYCLVLQIYTTLVCYNSDIAVRIAWAPLPVTTFCIVLVWLSLGQFSSLPLCRCQDRMERNQRIVKCIAQSQRLLLQCWLSNSNVMQYTARRLNGGGTLPPWRPAAGMDGTMVDLQQQHTQQL